LENTFTTLTTSGGKSRAAGFEAEFSVAPMRGMELQASVAHLSTRWIESGIQNIPPNTMWGFAPKWTYHLGAQQTFSLGDNKGQITLRGDYGYQSAYERDSDPGRQLLKPEPGFGLLNARIQYAPPNRNWNVQLFGTNLTDVAHVDAGTGSVYLFGVDLASIGERRMYGVRVNFDY
jgi:iron complex outermembrane receptor protein